MNTQESKEIVFNENIGKEDTKEYTKEDTKEEVKNLEVDIKNNILNLILDKNLQSAIKAADKVVLNNNSLLFYFDSSKKINQTYKNLIKISKEKIKNYILNKYNINEIVLVDDSKKKMTI